MSTQQATTAPREREGLARIGGRPPVGAYLAKLWSRRHFATQLAYSRFRARNEEDRLGIGWTVLGPLLNAAVYGVIFGLLLAGNRPKHFVPYLVTGVFVFQYFAACFAEGARSILGNMGLIRSLHFPRALLPVALVLQQLFALIPMMAVLFILVLLQGEQLGVDWLLIPLALGLMTLFNLGVAFIVARLTVHISDIAQLIPFVSRLLFYTSGIFFSPVQTFGGSGKAAVRLVGTVMEHNPIYEYISLIRESLIQRGPGVAPYATGTMWIQAAAWAVISVTVGFFFFYRAEELYGRE